MMVTRGWLVVRGGLSLYFFVLGFAGGMTSERIRFDRERTAEAPSAGGAPAHVVR